MRHGNDVEDDGCTSRCHRTRCHDGLVEVGEICYGPAGGQFVGRAPINLAEGDFDEDGVPDLVIAVWDAGLVRFRRGLGDGYFEEGPPPLPMPGVLRVAVADMNKDGHLDFIVGGTSGDVVIGWGDGHFSFPFTQRRHVFAQVGGVAVGDFDRDGHRDVVATELSGTNVAFFYGASDHVLPAPVNVAIKLGNSVTGVGMAAVADFNHDGFDDVATPLQGAYGAGTVILLSAGSNRQFRTTSISWVESVREISIGDFNDDKIPDLVSTADGNVTETFVVNLGVGDGTFLPGRQTSVLDLADDLGGGISQSVAVGDIDRDGHDDVVIALHGADTGIDANGDGEDVVAIAYGDGSGGFPDIHWHGTPNWPSGIAIADFNKDNRADLAVGGFLSNNVGILLGSQAKEFMTPARLTPRTGASVAKGLIADFDGDGKADVIAQAGRAWYRGHGDGTLDLPIAIGQAGNVEGDFAVGDMDGDGRAEIAFLDTATLSGYSIIHRDAGGNITQTNTPLMFDSRSAHIALIDCAGTGRPEVVITTSTFGRGTVRLGGGPALATFNNGAGNVVCADFDGDGHPDLVVDTYSGPVYLKGNGPSGGTRFSAPVSMASQIGYHALATGDFNGDGLPDVAVSTYDLTISNGDHVDIYLGDRSKVFGAPQPTSWWRARALAVVDLDGDGRIDLASDTGAGITVRLGLGDGHFGAARTIASGTTFSFNFSTGNLNNDGRPDFLVSAQRTDIVMFLSDP